MTRQVQEGEIFLAVAEKMPEIRQRPTTPRNGSNDIVLRFADVCLALGPELSKLLLTRWNLHKDSIYDQTNETVAFIMEALPKRGA